MKILIDKKSCAVCDKPVREFGLGGVLIGERAMCRACVDNGRYMTWVHGYDEGRRELRDRARAILEQLRLSGAKQEEELATKLLKELFDVAEV